MAKSAILAIHIIADAASAVSAMTKAQRQAMSFGDKLKKAGAVAGAALGAITVGAKQCVDAAADLQQSVGGVETVFGSSAAQMLEWSRQAAQSAGLSQNAYNEMATVIGSQLQNMGMSMEDSAVKTNELIHLGADLSSMFGGTTTQAVEALSSALKGEMDPIEAYGISLNDATLQAQAASMGLGDLYKAGDRNAKMQAILAAVTEQSGKAVGNFAREADTAQGQQQRMTAAWENAQAALGEALLPALTLGAQKLAEFATWVQQNASWITPLVAAVGALAGVIVAMNAAWGVYNTVQAIVQATTLRTSAAFGVLAGVTGIGLLIAAITLLVQNWDAVKAAGAAAADWISQRWAEFTAWFSGQMAEIQAMGQAVWNAMPGWAQNACAGIGDAFGWLAGAVTGDHDKMAQSAQSLYERLPGWAQTGVTAAGNAFDLLVATFTGDHDRMRQAARNLYDQLPGWAQSAVNGIVGFFDGMVNSVKGAFDSLVSAAKSAWDSITGFFSGIGDAVSSAIDTVTGWLPFSLDAAPNVMEEPRAYRMARAIGMDAAARPSGVAPLAMPDARRLYTAVRSGVQVRPVVVNETVNVTFSDLMPDPDKTARKIEQLLEARTRRRVRSV